MIQHRVKTAVHCQSVHFGHRIHFREYIYPEHCHFEGTCRSRSLSGLTSQHLYAFSVHTSPGKLQTAIWALEKVTVAIFAIVTCRPAPAGLGGQLATWSHLRTYVLSHLKSDAVATEHLLEVCSSRCSCSHASSPEGDMHHTLYPNNAQASYSPWK